MRKVPGKRLLWFVCVAGASANVGAGPVQAIGKTVGLRPTGHEQLTGPHREIRTYSTRPRTDRHATHGMRTAEAPTTRAGPGRWTTVLWLDAGYILGHSRV